MIFNLPDCNQQVACFNSLYDLIVLKIVPNRRFVIKPKSVPWVNNYLIKFRKRAYNLWKRFSNRTTRLQCVKARNSVTRGIRIAKTNYYNGKHKSIKHIWRNIKTLGVVNDKCNNMTLCEDINDLNKHFCTIPRMCVILPLPDLNYKAFIESARFSFIACSDNEVDQAIKQIKSLAVGYDNVNLALIKRFIYDFLPVLTHIFNYCILSSTFPDIWKVSKIVPLPKVSVPRSVNDFRPINILSVLSKILENILNNQIKQYLSDYELLSNFQSGFGTKYSTTPA